MARRLSERFPKAGVTAAPRREAGSVIGAQMYAAERASELMIEAMDRAGDLDRNGHLALGGDPDGAIAAVLGALYETGYVVVAKSLTNEVTVAREELDRLRTLAEWLISMDDPEDVLGSAERREVNLTKIINRAREALPSDGAKL